MNHSTIINDTDIPNAMAPKHSVSVPKDTQPGSFKLFGQVPQTDRSALTRSKAGASINKAVSRLKSNWTKVGLGLILPILFVSLWEGLEMTKMVSSALIPTPFAVFKVLEIWAGYGPTSGSLFFTGQLAADIFATLERVLVGFGLAVIFGLVLGVAIGMYRIADDLLTPTIRVLGPVPPITWIPVAIVVLGTGELTNFFLTFLGALFPIVAGTAIAVLGVDRNTLRVGRMMGWKGLSLIRYVVFPASLPSVVGSLRVGLSVSWLMAVTSEMVAVHSGLGYTLWNAYNYLDYPAVFAAMFVIGICGLSTDVILRLATKSTLEWHSETGVRS